MLPRLSFLKKILNAPKLKNAKRASNQPFKKKLNMLQEKKKKKERKPIQPY